MQTLTDKQRKVLDFIRSRIAHNLPPTIREIARELGFSSTGTVRDYLQALQQKGYLKRSKALSRAIELTQGSLGIPIIARIAAGNPALAYEDIEGHINPDDLFLGRLSQADVFAVKVKGVSMVEAGIMDGDIAIIKKQPHANNGDIVAALLEDNEVTLKRLKYKAHTAFLEPANPAYQPIYKDFSVIGKLITIIRKY
ncbi:MAG: transcriptional repressor LexA [Candidatus Omnitrophica bacterium]|nr:transcriptional repressor LexA [Candidatus Omnitrophota bacterium]